MFTFKAIYKIKAKLNPNFNEVLIKRMIFTSYFKKRNKYYKKT